MSDKNWIPVAPGSMPEYDEVVFVIDIYKSITLRGKKIIPIETAVLIFEVADDISGWVWAAGFYGGYLNDPGSYEFDDDCQYTHWQPLLDLPEANND